MRAYRFRAYSSNTTARVLKTQLEVACKLYNTLLHAEKEEYERNKHTMNKTELRQLALDPVSYTHLTLPTNREV